MPSAPVSLYLDLEDGQIADLEVVAKASLALVAALKEIAFQIDPLLDIRVEIESGTKGSLSINTWVKAQKSKYVTKKNIAAVALIFLAYFKDEIKDYAAEQVLDEYMPHLSEPDFSEKQKQGLKQIINEALEKRIGRKETGRIYRELDADPKVTGVGATAEKNKKPKNIIPKSQFKQRSDLPPITLTTITKRSTDPRVTVTLIKPALEHAHRSWRLKDANGEFGAIMVADDFLNGLLSEGIRIPMIEGLQLDVTLHIEEEKVSGGAWEVKSRKITAVHGFKRPPVQHSLLTSQLRPSVDANQDDDD